jgi:hypothetical protein
MVKRLLPAVFCLLSVIPVFGQDSVWNDITTREVISKVLSIHMQKPVQVMDTTYMKVFNSHFGSSYFQVRYFEQKFVVKNERELEQAYNSFLQGYLNSDNGKLYQNTVSDTSISGTSGKWIRSVISRGNYYREIFSYLTLANDRFYQINYVSTTPMSPETGVNFKEYFGSIKFDSAQIKEYSSDFKREAKSYRLGQKIGYYMRPAVLVLVIGAILYFLLRGLLRKKETA